MPTEWLSLNDLGQIAKGLVTGAFSGASRSDDEEAPEYVASPQWEYCAVKGDCSCNLPKVCADDTCNCGRRKVCVRPNCSCSRERMCSNLNCSCGRPKVKTT
jgi:hypothetical protein